MISYALQSLLKRDKSCWKIAFPKKMPFQDMAKKW